MPRQYRAINNVTAIIYDQLVSIFTPLYNPLKSTTISLDRENHSFVKELENQKIHALDWLAKNNLTKELSVVATKHIVLSIVSDFVNFVYESLNSAKKGKLTVAYALARKPFLDELLLLE